MRASKKKLLLAIVCTGLAFISKSWFVGYVMGTLCQIGMRLLDDDQTPE